MPSFQELIGLGEAPRLAAANGNVLAPKTGVGTTQVGATPITTNFSVLTTAGGALAFILPVSPAGAGPFVVVNITATAASVFPPSGNSIGAGGTDVAFSVAQNKPALFWKTSSTAWAACLSA